MRVKKVNRYYCEFCKKANCSGPSIKKHESRCTNNPQRECGVCKTLLEVPQPELSKLIAMLPVPTSLAAEWNMEEDKRMTALVAEVLPKLREAANDCPACIMAALRQAKIPVPLAEGFNFKEEMKSKLADYNDAQLVYQHPY